MNIATLTEFEILVLKHLGDEGAGCTGATNAIDMRDDFMAFDLWSDTSKATKLSRSQLAGVVTSLSKKGLAYADASGHIDETEIWLDDQLGVDAYYAIVERDARAAGPIPILGDA
jgi:hypothetical protein